MSAAKKLLHEYHPQSRTKFGSNFELWAIGGASIVWFAGCHLLADDVTNHVYLTFLYLSWVCNWPHFAASYQLLYWDKLPAIRQKATYFFAAIVVPLALGSLMFAGFWGRSLNMFPFLVQVMYFTVGWHYAGQTFGIMVVSSAAEGYFFNKEERFVLKVNLFSIWAASFFGLNVGTEEKDFYGLKYHLLDLPQVCAKMAYALVAVSLLVVVYSTVRRYARNGRWPAPMAFVVFVSLYAWFLPNLYQARFNYMVPFFHCLQYLVFLNILRRNQWAAKFSSLQPEEARLATTKSYLWHFGGAVILGALGFWFIPRWLDGSAPDLYAALWGGQIFFALFNIFINVHHYFIDAVIWKKDNADMQYLFKAQ